MLAFYFILSTSWPIKSFPAAMNRILRPELLNHLPHPCHLINNSILLHPDLDPAPASLFCPLIYEEYFSDVQWWLQKTARWLLAELLDWTRRTKLRTWGEEEPTSGASVLLLSVQPILASHGITFELWKKLQLQVAACQSLVPKSCLSRHPI